MKLGILVVYYVRRRLNWFVKLQLRQIKRNTREIDYQIFAVPLRLHHSTRHLLEGRSRITLIESDPARIEGISKEHSHYLDLLVDCAVEQGCTHFVTLDADSFPVRPGWATELSRQLSEQMPVAAVFRAENGDICLPHPSGLMCDVEFYKKYRPSFFPPETERSQMDEFLRTTGQRTDTGIGYAMTLQQNGLDWVRLNRSNAVDIHPILGGVYGGIFYHLGAMGRRPIGHADWAQSRFRRFIKANKNLPIIRSVKKKLARKIASRNDQIRAQILERLKSDSDAYFAELNGENGCDASGSLLPLSDPKRS